MKFVPGHTVGIDLGTTFSTVARLDERGDPVSIPNALGQSTTASVVLLADEGPVLVGPSPERLSLEPAQNIVQAIKREMGQKNVFRPYKGKQLTPEFLSGLILKKLKQDAEARIGKIGNAVITVPYYFTDPARKATSDAGRIAGFQVVDIINEPTAATLAYAWTRGDLGRAGEATEKTIMVYDLGGGTFDVTVVRYTPTHFRVVATDGDVRLGGLDWTNRIAEHIARQFTQKYGLDPFSDADLKIRFTQDCELAKRELSRVEAVPLSLAFQGKSLRVSVTREAFERMTADLLQRTLDTTEYVLQQAGVDPLELEALILVGGSTHMPAVQRALRELSGKAPTRDIDPDTAVAQGAAIHAALLEAQYGSDPNRLQSSVIRRLMAVSRRDVNSHALGVEITDFQNGQTKRNHVMIPRNTPIPHSVTQRFVTTTTNPKAIRFRLLEGEAADVNACTPIGDLRITGLPAGLPAGSPVEVTYSFDVQGRIQAKARELTGQREAAIEIVRDAGLTEVSLLQFEELAQNYRVE